MTVANAETRVAPAPLAAAPVGEEVPVEVRLALLLPEAPDLEGDPVGEAPELVLEAEEVGAETNAVYNAEDWKVLQLEEAGTRTS